VGRPAVYLLTLGGAAVAFAFWHMNSRSGAPETVFQPPSSFVEPASMCPWREPESDLRQFFPEATRYETETHILSGQRLELKERLGRLPDAEENSVYLRRVLQGEQSIGSILTRRVKGEHGAIELVLALNPNQTVRGVRLQRLREPDPAAAALRDSRWLGAFAGKDARATLRVGQDLPELPAEARASGERIAEGVHSLLVLMDVAENGPAQVRHH
jgi:hypothetical protein